MAHRKGRGVDTAGGVVIRCAGGTGQLGRIILATLRQLASVVGTDGMGASLMARHWFLVFIAATIAMFAAPLNCEAQQCWDFGPFHQSGVLYGRGTELS